MTHDPFCCIVINCQYIVNDYLKLYKKCGHRLSDHADHRLLYCLAVDCNAFCPCREFVEACPAEPVHKWNSTVKESYEIP
jgi:hypothetical protein